MSVQFIDEQKTLNTVLPELNNAGQIAIDLEFDKNYYRYGFNLCLMQLSDGDNIYLIDPLSSSLQINTIFPVLENPEIEKVAFAFGEDLRLLHSIGCFPKNIYDLDNAISLLNYSPASLTNHLQNILEIDTGKSSQMSNWYHRPLSDDQLHYAAEDVRHLLILKDHLQTEAKEKELSGWIEEENRVMDLADHSNIDNNDVIKEKDKNDFTETEWHIYVRLMETREEIAEKLNKPSFQVIQKEIIQKAAKDPGRLEKWKNTRGIFKRIKTDRMKKKLLTVVRDAREEAAEKGLSDTDPANKPPSADQKKYYREQREKVNRAKREFFTPIKEQIEDDYGKEVSTFLFSNRIISETISEDQQLLHYKMELLRHYADKLNLDINEYLKNR
ncbi:ribonuclease D [Rhodohalobacter sp. SW132]|uniref:ribonuclease D n=1 Tax=Rhodohalobacter sp. SW132 TaxID=2293433 RepID=UPI000E261EDB|nr:ribonuclease D [Rhodohalobacter sp. SW132]REL24050.1 ribonuclease D [Rhodohalobacter sp. SW132]